MSPQPLKLTFNYAASDARNEYGLIRNTRITPRGATAALFAPGFVYEVSAVRAMPLAHSLSRAAAALREIVQAYHPAQPLAEDVDFTDENDRTQTIPAARFTPH